MEPTSAINMPPPSIKKKQPMNEPFAVNAKDKKNWHLHALFLR